MSALHFCKISEILILSDISDMEAIQVCFCKELNYSLPKSNNVMLNNKSLPKTNFQVKVHFALADSSPARH